MSQIDNFKTQIIASFRSEAALQLFRDLMNDGKNHGDWRKKGESCTQATARIAVERIDALIEALRK